MNLRTHEMVVGYQGTCALYAPARGILMVPRTEHAELQMLNRPFVANCHVQMRIAVQLDSCNMELYSALLSVAQAILRGRIQREARNLCEGSFQTPKQLQKQISA